MRLKQKVKTSQIAGLGFYSFPNMTYFFYEIKGKSELQKGLQTFSENFSVFRYSNPKTDTNQSKLVYDSCSFIIHHRMTPLEQVLPSLTSGPKD